MVPAAAAVEVPQVVAAVVVDTVDLAGMVVVEIVLDIPLDIHQENRRKEAASSKVVVEVA